MRIFGIAGWSGSGKTTLLARVIPELCRLGLEVATVKHTHHDPAMGDDDARTLGTAGAEETLIASARRFALVHHPDGRDEPGLEALSRRFGAVDLLLVEGFKRSPHPKLEVWDSALGKPMLAGGEASVVALASDRPVSGLALPRFHRDDAEGIAAFIAGFGMTGRYSP